MEKRVLRKTYGTEREEEAGEWRKFHIEDFMISIS